MLFKIISASGEDIQRKLPLVTLYREFRDIESLQHWQGTIPWQLLFSRDHWSWSRHLFPGAKESSPAFLQRHEPRRSTLPPFDTEVSTTNEWSETVSILVERQPKGKWGYSGGSSRWMLPRRSIDFQFQYMLWRQMQARAQKKPGNGRRAQKCLLLCKRKLTRVTRILRALMRPRR